MCFTFLYIFRDKKTLFYVEVNNLTDVYTGFMEPKEDCVTDFKGVKAHFGLDTSGLITLNYIEALFERQWKNNGKNEASTFASSTKVVLKPA